MLAQAGDGGLDVDASCASVATAIEDAAVAQLEDAQAASKATMAMVTLAATIAMSEAAGASREQLRRVAARTGAVRVHIEKASACPMSAE
eukprot:2717273-Pleurochrysis_carterae.AAC.1